MKAFIFSILVLLFFITSCNKNDVITEEIKQAPIIELDSETGIYTIKVGRELTIAPTYKYANNALYAWTVDGKLLSSESILKYTWNQEQHLYIKLRVDTPEGYAEEELKVEVLELTPPTISIIIPSKGLKVPQNTDYIYLQIFNMTILKILELNGYAMEKSSEQKSIYVSRKRTRYIFDNNPGIQYRRRNNP